MTQKGKTKEINELTVLNTFLVDKRRWARCLCSCGTYTVKRYDGVMAGKTRSCGHLLATTNRLSASSTYNSYRNMLARCYYPKHNRYRHYGGRGIKVCDRWRESFNNFVEDMGVKPDDKLSLDRIDNNKDYSPENCRWATYLEQMNNTSRNTHHWIEGEKLTISQAARKYDVNVHSVHTRLRAGDSIERALRI